MFLIIVGMILLYVGAESLVRGSSQLAAYFWNPPSDHWSHHCGVRDERTRINRQYLRRAQERERCRGGQCDRLQHFQHRRNFGNHGHDSSAKRPPRPDPP